MSKPSKTNAKTTPNPPRKTGGGTSFVDRARAKGIGPGRDAQVPKRGRPTAWTPKMEEMFFQALLVGLSLRDCCRFAGVAFESMQNRRFKPQAPTPAPTTENPDPQPPPREVSEFGRRIEHQMLEVKVGLLGRMAIHSQKNHNATAWILEHRWPEEYGRRTNVELTGANKGPIKVEVDVDADLAVRLRGGEPGHAAVWDALTMLSPEDRPKLVSANESTVK